MAPVSEVYMHSYTANSIVCATRHYSRCITCVSIQNRWVMQPIDEWCAHVDSRCNMCTCSHYNLSVHMLQAYTFLYVRLSQWNYRHSFSLYFKGIEINWDSNGKAEVLPPPPRTHLMLSSVPLTKLPIRRSLISVLAIAFTDYWAKFETSECIKDWWLNYILHFVLRGWPGKTA